MRGLVTALRTLTVLPIPGKEAVRFCSALHWFPVVGLLLGLIQAGAGYLSMAAGWSEFAAAVVLLAGVLLTRGIHVDGFADVADGFFGGGNVERRLRIMKDPAVGSFGALSLVLLFIFKWVVLVKLISLGLYDWIVSGVVLARLSQVLLASSLPYARNEGGTASGFVDGAGPLHLVSSVSISFIILFVLFNGIFLPFGFALLAASVSVAFSGFLSLKKIEGVTGDVLGASSELTEALVWGAGAVFFMSLC